MNYLFDYALLPKQKVLLKDINASAGRLAKKLESLNGDKSGLSEYCQRVLSDKKEVLTAYLQIYTYVLSWALHGSNLPYSKLTILEYGGGMGFISMLAKELGVGNVVYNDIFEESRQGAQRLGALVGCVADHYVCGDTDDVIEYSRKHDIQYDGIASFDVIEHIYDIESFLEKLASFPGSRLKVVMTSAANMYYKRYTKDVMQFQRQCELLGQQPSYGHYDRDTLRPYLDIRKELITEFSKDLSADEIDKLAVATRGLRQDDILNAVNAYLKTGQLPKVPRHPTNTCDPYTGNWQEHLMDPSELVTVMRRAGFEADWFSGYYSGRYGNIVKQFLARGANAVIGVMNQRAIRFAKFYTLYGVRQGEMSVAA
ncbi:MAG: hypothetical protein V4568_00355 [Pseudomonadota bacterium]